MAEMLNRLVRPVNMCTNRAVDAPSLATGNAPQREQLRRGKSILGREEDVHESGLALFKRGTTLRRKKVPTAPVSEKKRSCMDKLGPGPKGPWFMYCYIITCLVPPPLLRACGKSAPTGLLVAR